MYCLVKVIKIILIKHNPYILIDDFCIFYNLVCYFNKSSRRTTFTMYVNKRLFYNIYYSTYLLLYKFLHTLKI